MAATVRRKVTSHITTFGNLVGVKIVKYNPVYHDDYINRRDFQGPNDLDVFLDVKRNAAGLDTHYDDVSDYRKLEIYLLTTVQHGDLKVFGIIAWCGYKSDEYSNLWRICGRNDRAQQLYRTNDAERGAGGFCDTLFKHRTEYRQFTAH